MFSKRFSAILKTLKFWDKAKSGELTKEDWAKIAASYKETHGVDMYADQADEAAQSDKAAQHDAALELINSATEGGEDDGDGDGDGGDDGAATTQEPVNLETAVASILESNKTTAAALKKVTEQMENDTPPTAEIKFDASGVAMPHSDTHLFGVSNAIYDRARRHNVLFLNPSSIHTMGEASNDEISQFATDLSGFGAIVGASMNALHAEGQLSAEILRSSSNPDLAALTNAGIGDSFTQFRVRELIARVLEVPSPFGIFPLRSGVQDRELITNAFVGELTQAFQDSETSLKGSGSLEPEIGYVDDAMILSKFGNFKEMERKYIGYLNTNGSDPVKWSMIEYFMLLYMMQAIKEQYQRVVRGIYLKPAAGTPGHYLNASTGQIPRMLLYHFEKKLRVYEDVSLASYDGTGTVFIDAVIELASWLKSELDPLGLEVEQNLAIHLNKNHREWFKKGYRTKYNQHGDFDGIHDTKVPDTDLPIVWVPNMGTLKIMWATKPGNQQCLENIRGEMFKFYMERRLNNVYVTSNWKEGAASGYVGRKAADKATLDVRAWDQQMIWFPKPYTALADGATTPDAANGFWFKSVANAGATVIDTIDNKTAGQMYVIECGHLTNKSTISKAGDFSDITAVWTPTAVGDAIVVVWDAGAAKFKEICRVVGGNLTYNAATTPNAR